MPNIRLKRSLTSGSLPTTASLTEGELAMNVPDGRIFLRKSGSGTDTIESAITTGARNSGSVQLTGSMSVSGSGDILTAQGDNIYFTGNLMEFSGDVFEMTGSVKIVGSTAMTGSLGVSGSLTVLQGITGSLFGTASYATTASYSLNNLSSSYAITASYWSGSILNATSASYSANALSSSYATTASYVQAYEVNQIIITTTASITTDTTGSSGFGQSGRNVLLDNGANAINLTCDTGSVSNFVASYTKLGSSAITFVAGAGATLTQVDSTAILNGIVGSTACLTRNGNTYYLQISNR